MPQGVYSGVGVYLEFRGTSFDAAFKTVKIDEGQNTANSTAGADTHETTLGTTKTIAVSASLLDRNNAAGSAIRANSRVGQSGTLVIGPQGSAAGNPKYSAVMRVGSAPRTWEHQTETKYDINWVLDISSGGTGWLENYDDDVTDVFP